MGSQLSGLIFWRSSILMFLGIYYYYYHYYYYLIIIIISTGIIINIIIIIIITCKSNNIYERILLRNDQTLKQRR